MHPRCRRLLPLPALLATLVPSCAEAPTLLPDAGADATVVPVASNEPLVCDEVVTWPSSNGADIVDFRRYHWDPKTRARTQESRKDSSFDGTVKSAWRYDSEGKEVAHAGFAQRSSGSSYGNFQRDQQFDEHGNLSDSHLSYPDKPDVSAPSEASIWMGTRFEHEYDAQGNLRASDITLYGPGNPMPLAQRIEYGHDAANRCETKLTNVAGRDPVNERFVYDDRDRLIEEHQTGRSNPPLGCTGAVTIIEYDEQDRVTARRTWACGHALDTPADIEIVHSYNSEGFRRTDTYNFLTDVVNHKVETPEGEERWASYTIETHSAECAEMAAAIGGLAPQNGHRCRAD